ncbi:MAG: polysaccharide synthesis protein GtrA [Frankiales bacterium]|nr:polysaccharide synthesis protein GtrA [Frankiales bacterium]
MSPVATDSSPVRVASPTPVRHHPDVVGDLSPAPRLSTQAVSFLLIGGIATLVDIGLFNVCLGLGTGPILGKVLSTVAGGVVAFLGNREFSFGEQGDDSVRRQAVTFALVSLAALGLALIPLAVTSHALGLNGALALNVANGVGLVVATAFRFYGCRRWVFVTSDAVPEAELLAYEDSRIAA